ncbi:MAG: YadA-like family protein, partial [Stenotrophomonas sp.]|uniref:YadA-like family protein n=1 Tax=Stenotrophomonas sp. TaxID=69392 RepID=UPI003D6D2BE1
LGRSANSSGAASTAVGFNSAASAANAMAFGANSAASGANATAFGTGTVASGADSTAVGNAASATATNSVALGAGSVADESNTVSVGAAGAERKVTNVAAGTNDTDAVNVSQLNDTAATTLASANTYTDQQISLLGAGGGVASADLEQLRTDMNDRFAGVDGRLDAIDNRLNKMDRRLNRQGAMAAAYNQTAGMPDVGANWLGVGVGGYESETAIAVTLRRRFTSRATGSIGAATSGGETSYGVGVGFTWGGN